MSPHGTDLQYKDDLRKELRHIDLVLLGDDAQRVKYLEDKKHPPKRMFFNNLLITPLLSLQYE